MSTKSQQPGSVYSPNTVMEGTDGTMHMTLATVIPVWSREQGVRGIPAKLAKEWRVPNVEITPGEGRVPAIIALQLTLLRVQIQQGEDGVTEHDHHWAMHMPIRTKETEERFHGSKDEKVVERSEQVQFRPGMTIVPLKTAQVEGLKPQVQSLALSMSKLHPPIGTTLQIYYAMTPDGGELIHVHASSKESIARLRGQVKTHNTLTWRVWEKGFPVIRPLIAILVSMLRTDAQLAMGHANWATLREKTRGSSPAYALISALCALWIAIRGAVICPNNLLYPPEIPEVDFIGGPGERQAEVRRYVQRLGTGFLSTVRSLYKATFMTKPAVREQLRAAGMSIEGVHATMLGDLDNELVRAALEASQNQGVEHAKDLPDLTALLTQLPD